VPTLSPSDLGWRLQTVRAAIWEASATGDPYALILRDLEDDVSPWFAAAAARGPVHRSVTGSWVVTDPDLGAEVLRDSRLGRRRRDGSKALQQILPLDESRLDDEREAVRLPALPAYEPVVAQVCAARPGSARELAVEVVSRLTGLSDLAGIWTDLAPALDALVTPQPLCTTLALTRALRELDGHPCTPLIAIWAATLETAIRRPGPAMWLHTRVAREELRLADAAVAPDEQVVVLGGLDDPGHYFGAALPLTRLVAEAAGPALRQGPALRRRRSPVTRALG